MHRETLVYVEGSHDRSHGADGGFARGCSKYCPGARALRPGAASDDPAPGAVLPGFAGPFGLASVVLEIATEARREDGYMQ